MESNNVLLSICIPTYNGGSYLLKVILDSLIPEIQKYNGLIEVVVSDNCSNDNTSEILESFDIYNYYRHYRNSSNLGFNGNMLLLADKYAVGEYCWFNGDDDFIIPSSLPFVIDCLKQKEYDYVSLQFERTRLSSLEESLKQSFDYSVNVSSFVKAIDTNCLRGNSLGTFMSSAVFRTDVFRSLPKDKFQNKFDSFFNVFPNAYLMATGFHNRNCAIIKDPVLLVIEKEKDWSTSDNMYMIVSSALVDMYNYFLSLGMKKSELTISRRRLIYDNLKIGIRRLLKAEKVNKNLLAFFLESLKYPRIHFLLIGSVIRRILGKKIIDIG